MGSLFELLLLLLLLFYFVIIFFDFKKPQISIYKEGSIVICRIMGANGYMTGGLVDQLKSLLVQIHNMTGLTGVVFHLVGPMKGPVHFNPDLPFETAGAAAKATQRLSIDLINCQPITVCAFSSELSGVGLEVFAHCDFLFGHETHSTVKVCHDRAFLSFASFAFVSSFFFLPLLEVWPLSCFLPSCFLFVHSLVLWKGITRASLADWDVSARASRPARL